MTETEQIERIAAELHENGTCNVMFAHYGPFKKCEDVAKSLYKAGIRYVTSPDKN